MPRKSFEAGMEAGAKPFEEKFQKQADAIEKVGARMDSRLDEISGVMDVMMDDLSAQERKRVYDLNTVVDISELENTEKEYLCALVYAIANLNSELNEYQKDYMRSLKSYLQVVNVQNGVDLSSVENIDNITTQKAILQTIMEFLFLEYGNHDYMDDYDDIFDYFSVNRKGIKEIQDGIDAIYTNVGLEGLAEHYGSAKKVTIIQGASLSKAELDLRETAESAYRKFDIKTAFPLFNILASQGDGRSCYFLAQIYEQGYQDIVTKDNVQAIKYIEQGVAANDLLCLLQSAQYSEAPEQIYSETLEAITALADDGDVVAMYELAKLYDFAYIKIQNTNKAEYWYSLSSKEGYWCAMLGLANLYFSQGEYKKAFALYKSVYDRGNPRVATNLAQCYLNGFGIEKDTKIAHQFFIEAANAGDAESQDYIGKYELKKGNYDSAKIWLELAINNGVKSSYYELAKAIYSCRGDKKTILTVNGKQYEAFDYWLSSTYYLILGAMEGNETCIVELLGNTLPTWWWILYKQGKFETWDNELLIGDKTYKLVDFQTGDDSWYNSFKSENWNIINRYHKAGNSAASYYLGMQFVNQYSIWKDKANKEAAINCLTKAQSGGISANIDEALKKLRIGRAFTWPYPQSFVV